MFVLRKLLCVMAWFSLVTPLAAATTDEPFFPFGVYDKSEHTVGGAEWEAHYRQMLGLLRENNINTLVTIPYKNVAHTLFVMNLVDASGMRVIMSAGNPQNPQWDMVGPTHRFHRAYSHRSVLGYKFGDEPLTTIQLDDMKSKYGAIRCCYTKPIVTAMVGELMTGTVSDFALTVWAAVRAETLFARHYPIRRTYDLTNWYREKISLPLENWATVMERYAAGRPWWFILQTFGRGTAKTHASYWRLPTVDEVEAMTHIALANGARGVVAFCLQTFGIEKAALVDVKLRPMAAHDGSFPLNAMRNLGALTQQHAALLLRHQTDSFSVRSSAVDVLVMPRRDPLDGSRYVYAVNKNTVQAQDTTIRFEASMVYDHAVDVFTDHRVQVMASASGAQFAAVLAPGQGRFWRLIPASLPSAPKYLLTVPQ